MMGDYNVITGKLQLEDDEPEGVPVTASHRGRGLCVDLEGGMKACLFQYFTPGRNTFECVIQTDNIEEAGRILRHAVGQDVADHLLVAVGRTIS